MVYKNLPKYPFNLSRIETLKREAQLRVVTIVVNVLKIQNECSTQAQSFSVNHMIQEGRKPLCTTIVGYVSDSQTVLQSPVQFALSYSLVQVAPHLNQMLMLPS